MANPDAEARSRVVDLARGAVTRRTRIVELATLGDFAALLEQTPDELREQQQVATGLEQLRRRIQALDAQIDDLDDRTSDLTWTDVADLESRLDALERDGSS